MPPWAIRTVLETLRAEIRGIRRGTHILLCIADHYEPSHGRANFPRGLERVNRWVAEYPSKLGRFSDADGIPPQHSFFFPLEEYVPEYMDQLATLCHAGYGEVEVHLHHHDDSADNLRASLTSFTKLLRERHGLLSEDAHGSIRYGFVHGNYALDNSRADGKWCGVNDELTVLVETGCYGDFTLPSAPDSTQTSTINSIYFATDDVARPKSHDGGSRAKVASVPPANALLILQGALALNLRRRKWGVVPRLENSELLHNNPPTATRVLSCANMGICVSGRPEWVFVKLHTHGAVERNADVLLGPAGVRFHEQLSEAVQARGLLLHYVTARQLANIAWAAIDGRTGNPNEFRDYRFRLPVAKRQHG